MLLKRAATRNAFHASNVVGVERCSKVAHERFKRGATMTNPLLELKALGQSVWLDDIDRGKLRSGLFGRLIEEDGLSGATGNPTIFEHSISNDTTYDEQMQQLFTEGKKAQQI